MALKTNIQNILGNVWTALDDMRQTVTYSSYTGTIVDDYNEVTGVVTRTETTETVKDAAFVRFRKGERTGSDVLDNDRKVLIPNAKITATPKKDDQITDAAGKIWEVKEVSTDPLDSLWILQVR